MPTLDYTTLLTSITTLWLLYSDCFWEPPGKTSMKLRYT
jgi:hypothetical protein